MIIMILLFCVLVLCIGIVIVLAADTGEVTKESEAGTHIHEEFVEKTGDTMTGDLVVQNLYANGVINGDGNRINNLNASEITTGTIDSERLPSNIDADTLDGYDSTDFIMATHDHNNVYYTKTETDSKYAISSHTHPSTGDADTLDGYDSTDFLMAAHTHDDRYYNKTASDARYTQVGHTHPSGDADTLDGLDSSDFAMAAHIHDDRYYNKTESDIRYAQFSHTHLPGDADTLDGWDSTAFAMAAHTHDTRYYLRSEVDVNFLNLSGGTLAGDLYLLNLYASGVISGDGSGLSNLNASRIVIGTLGTARLPPNIDADTLDLYNSSDFALAAHTHNASHIISGTLEEARLPQYAIDDSEIEIGLGLVPSGTIVMWNGTTIPDGWALCDGTNGTPDLRGMFIVGYDPSDPDYNSTGKTGGEKTHTLTITEMPQHRHSYSGSTTTDGSHQHDYYDYFWQPSGSGYNVDENDIFSDNQVSGFSDSTDPAGSHSHSYSGDTSYRGGSSPHENRPPFYALAFIMKL